ncbi:hypothetical protein [Streptomyces halobius]|uniref:Uncharacterized protein n=1 Tax=Streptomyces halobius TaxID=2879846 RepID=A0ABY4M141_9ACTN|nr:hypothetical protein [Streptomyces halobius]UQA90933.1 hypothetical protein K9S39_02710 [Streptomyces halobius]
MREDDRVHVSQDSFRTCVFKNGTEVFIDRQDLRLRGFVMDPEKSVLLADGEPGSGRSHTNHRFGTSDCAADYGRPASLCPVPSPPKRSSLGWRNSSPIRARIYRRTRRNRTIWAAYREAACLLSRFDPLPLRLPGQDHATGGEPADLRLQARRTPARDDWKAVALHRGARRVENVYYQGRTTAFVNVGAQMSSVLRHLAANSPGIHAEIETVRRD